MTRRWVVQLLIALSLALMATSCNESLPVQPTPEHIEDYFDLIVDEPDPITKYLDDCTFTIPISIFVEQVYYTYRSVRTAIPKSLVERGSDGSVENGEIIDVMLSCTEDVAVLLIQTTDTTYAFNDFYGEIDLSPEEAQAIRTDLETFQPE